MRVQVVTEARCLECGWRDAGEDPDMASRRHVGGEGRVKSDGHAHSNVVMSVPRESTSANARSGT
jgi:hypothetical protein